jgi:DNA-binding transcriptional ArsR family regulator
MPTSRARRSPRRWEDHALALAWGAWAELGVSGWTNTHGSWAIDPEPLILLTAGLGDRDQRLRDEATDWCIHNWRFVSRVRLRNLLREQPEAVTENYGEFAATVSKHAGVTWPGETQARERYRVTGRSTPPPLAQASLICLRARATFGVSARAEILRHLLARQGRAVSVARLSELTGYAKRNIAEESETLERAGVLGLRVMTNRFMYSLARRTELEALIGDLPDVFPNWTALLAVVLALLHLEEAEERLPHEAFVVEVHRILRDIEDDLDELEIDGPRRRPRGAALWTEFKEWGDELMADLGAGRWPANAKNSEVARIGGGRLVRKA